MLKFTNETGTGYHTKISNAETGESITSILAVSSAKIEIDRDLVRATCNLSIVKLDLGARAEFHTTNPVTGTSDAIRAIEFRDGTRVEIADDGTPTVVQAKKD